VAAAQLATGQPSQLFPPTQAAEQLYNGMGNGLTGSLALAQQQEMSLGPFIIPQPPPLSDDEVAECKLWNAVLHTIDSC